MATLFVDNLTVIDFSYLHATRGMIGESWIVDLELTGELDHAGMIFDFGLIKQQIKARIDECLDHKLAVPTESPALKQLQLEPSIDLVWHYPMGTIHMQAPPCSTAAIQVTKITRANVTEWLKGQLEVVLPDNITSIELILRQEDLGTAPYYHYSHGLKKHDGNCQRIAHGHRSAIEIYENNTRSRYWEKMWADRWDDIYIGSREDLQRTQYIEDIPHLVFAYTSSQGEFNLTLPEDHCYLVDTDTTVELLAQHIAEALTQEAPSRKFRVRAYEGVGKGAIAQAGNIKKAFY